MAWTSYVHEIWSAWQHVHVDTMVVNMLSVPVVVIACTHVGVQPVPVIDAICTPSLMATAQDTARTPSALRRTPRTTAVHRPTAAQAPTPPATGTC